MKSTAPPWLAEALDEALVSVGATAEGRDRRAVVDRLLQAWDLPGRTHHNARYLAALLDRLSQMENASSDPATLSLAAAYRGATEEPGWELLEHNPQPACVPLLVDTSTLRDLGVPEVNAARISELVSALGKHEGDLADLDAQILVDADLSIVASSPQKYREYSRGLREQSKHLSDEEFNAARLELVSTLLSRPRIFVSPLTRDLENIARTNLEGEQAILERNVDSQTREEIAKRVRERARARNKAGNAVARRSIIKTKRRGSAAATRLDEVPSRAPEVVSEGDWQTRDDTSTLESVAEQIEDLRKI